MTITLHSVVVAAKDQLSSAKVTSSDTVIAGFRKGNYYALGAVGTRVWQLLQQPVTAVELRRTIANEYDVHPDRCQSDVMALLQRMAEEGLIEVRR